MFSIFTQNERNREGYPGADTGEIRRFQRPSPSIFVSQQEILDMLILDCRAEELLDELRKVKAGRNQKREVMIEKMLAGASVEPGPLTVSLKKFLELCVRGYMIFSLLEMMDFDGDGIPDILVAVQPLGLF